MVTENFKTVRDLYERVLPALKSKKREFALKKMNFITENDIWNCLRRKKWTRDAELTLFDIVSDIFNLSEQDIFEYVNQKRSEKERN